MEKMLVPSNFMSWPRVADLLPDQKLIARELWCNQFVKISGVYILPIPMFSAAVSIASAAIQAALVDFEKRELILWDEKTGEIYNVDWLRFHTFKSFMLDQYFKEIENIQSKKIKLLVEEKTAIFGLKKQTVKKTPQKNKQEESCDEIEKMIASQIWYKKSEGGLIYKPLEFSMAIRARLKKEISHEDREILNLYSERMEKEKLKFEQEEKNEKKNAEIKSENVKVREETVNKLIEIGEEKINMLKAKFKECLKTDAELRSLNFDKLGWEHQIIKNVWLDWASKQLK